MKVIITKEKLRIFDNDAPNATVMEGLRSKSDGTWYLDVHKTSASRQHSSRQEHSVCEFKKKEDIIKFISHAMWNPVTSSWIKVINK